MELSNKAIQELRKELIRIYGSDFELSDDDLQGVGMYLLTSLAECLKYKNMVK
jgi:hypothetical protein